MASKLPIYIDAVVQAFEPGRLQVVDAFQRIAKELGRRDPVSYQLLALRRYLRIGGARLVSNWSWTELEVSARRSQEPAKTLYAEARKVQAAFAQENPGYTLEISPVRSLERQISLWTINVATVLPAGERLTKDMLRLLENRTDYPVVPSSTSIARFQTHLANAHVNPEPSSAAPGTSDHGRGTAVDFVIKRGRDLVAGTSTAGIRQQWMASGLAHRLQLACRGSRLKGPLQMPFEPWHWTLDPTARINDG